MGTGLDTKDTFAIRINLQGQGGAGRLGGMFVLRPRDIAVLGSPNGQELWDQAGAYDKLIEETSPLSAAAMKKQSLKAWFLSLSGLG